MDFYFKATTKNDKVHLKVMKKGFLLNKLKILLLYVVQNVTKETTENYNETAMMIMVERFMSIIY